MQFITSGHILGESHVECLCVSAFTIHQVVYNTYIEEYFEVLVLSKKEWIGAEHFLSCF